MEHLPATRPTNFCDACAIRNRAICADLDDSEIGLLNGIGRRRQLEAGEQLMWEGDEAVLVANVIDGVLKLASHSADGGEQILGLAYPSDFLGRPFGETVPYGVEALTEAQICVFERKDFDRFARDHPRLEHKLLERTLTELDRSRRWMMLLGRMNAGQKVASFLLELTDRLGKAGAGGESFVTLPLSRQQMADVLGLTIETVSRQLSRLRSAGLIDTPSRREIVLRDRRQLEELAG
ncbi:Crp/Fnr family transcriptional regulator [Qipengyuania flava]|uniref:Crp/Fnr family transcriptional regulator n=1 Tax=Qipengyuania flava TaxID=192812 RepID=UPI001C585CAC|nr:Crp/Fnr family transcriptional regulator [Qipengyuania flava]MBW3167912.1 Crp/Fnr family transcriptional regulator [Qipengyuania flava]MBY5965150.1 Crp/Fnr family transcriptional regulator [Qipengyuania flava]MBY6011474.1 Crp/Fnr family transcriptional regulator [Qipengyuania flava]MBY6025916.1 Crp/Fnr family transcriptional regulator [Qipengyuania flava]